MNQNYDKIIDAILKKMHKGKTINIYRYCRRILKHSHNQAHRVSEEMLRRGLVEKVNWLSELRIISTKGIRINDEGGWLKILTNQKRKKDLEFELIESQINSNRTATKTSKWAIIIGIISLTVSIITIAANLLGWFK